MSLGDVRLSLVEGMDDIRSFHEWLQRPRRVLGVDTETSGLSPERDIVRLIQFGDLHEGWAMSWADYRGIALEALDRYDHELAFHNSKFDVRMISSNSGRSVVDWPWHRTHDTMGMAHILDSQRTKALKPLAARYVDPQAVSGQRTLDEGMKKNGWSWETVPVKFPPYWQYAALDPVLTCHLFERFERVLTDFRDLYDLEMGAVRVAAKMEEVGMVVDLDYCHSKAKELEAYARQAREHLDMAYGLENPTNVQLVKWFQANGVSVIDKMTPSGAQSMDKEVLEAVDHPVAQLVLNVRRAEKLAGTYLENFVKFADDRGRLHPNIMTMGARTGRMAITEPALQTLPRKDPTVRRAFRPSPGNVLISCDYDQIEARLTAHFSQDPGLIAAFQSDEDFFCYIAGQMFQRPITKKDPERQLTKNATYGKIYGASVAKMASTAGVMTMVMRDVDARFNASYPGVQRMMQDVVNTGKRRRVEEGRGYVITPYGRKLLADEGKEYTLVNYLIQCHASEVLKRKMVDLDAALPKGADLLLPIHDEVLFDVPAESGQEVLQLIEETMSDSEYLVPITASADLMPNTWADKYGG